MVLVQTVTVGASGQSSIEFANVPQDATDLLILFSIRDQSTSTTALPLGLVFNGAYDANHFFTYVRGDGSTVFSNKNNGESDYARVNGSGTTSNTFGNASLYISNYAVSANKSFSVDSVVENNATASWQQITAGLWTNTAAITSIRLDAWQLFLQDSTASLYKITKA